MLNLQAYAIERVNRLIADYKLPLDGLETDHSRNRVGAAFSGVT